MRRLLAAVIVGTALGAVIAGQGPAVGLRAGDDFCGDVSPAGNSCGDALANDAVFGLRALDPFSFEFLSDTGGCVEANIVGGWCGPLRSAAPPVRGPVSGLLGRGGRVPGVRHRHCLAHVGSLWGAAFARAVGERNPDTRCSGSARSGHAERGTSTSSSTTGCLPSEAYASSSMARRCRSSGLRPTTSPAAAWRWPTHSTQPASRTARTP